MILKDLILKNRTYRRFYQEQKIETLVLKELINYARLSASPRNQQALKFAVLNNEEINNKFFPFLAWAGALKDWSGPKEGEKPAAYIVILGDNSIVPKGKVTFHGAAYGIAAQSITLGATELGLGACMIAAFNRKEIIKLLKISDNFEILLIIALGKPKEEVVLEKMPENGDFSYWRDKNGVHHVPKRNLEDLITDIFE